MLNFPSSPTNGQQHTVAGKSWEWTGMAWKSISATSALVERAEDAAAEAVASAAAAAQVEANMSSISTSLADAHAQLDGFGAEDGAGKVGYKGRTVYDKLGEFVSVFDSMTPQQIASTQNGTVMNLAVPIQTAVDSVSDTGGTVYFPRGVFRIDGPVILKDKVSLLGAGKSASELWFGAAGQIVMDGQAGAHVGRLSIERLGLTNQGGGAAVCLGLTRVQRITISECVIYNSNMALSGYNYVTISKCDLYGGKLIADHPDTDGISEALKVDLCNGSGFAIDVKDTADVVVSKTHLLGPASQLKIQRGAQNASFYPPVFLSDIVIDSSDDEALYLIGVSPQVSNVFVSGGRTNLKSGAYISQCVEGAFTNFRARFCGAHGVDISGCNGITFNAGVLNDNKVYGARMGESTNIRFIGTEAKNAPDWFGGSYEQQVGIADQPSNCTNIQVIGCDLAGNAVAGAYLPSGTNVLLGNIGV